MNPKTDKTRQPEPTREQLDEDLSIPASFDEVMDSIIAGHGTDPIDTCEGMTP